MIALFLGTVLAASVVDIVNNDPTSTWVAVEYPRSVITTAKFVAMLGEEELPHLDLIYEESETAPASFDGRSSWGSSLKRVRNQESCGSCWAHASTQAIGTRFALKRCDKGVLSVQDLVSCDTTDNGCNGGSGPTSMAWIKNKGVTTDACLPYVSGGGRVPACPAKCSNGSAITRYKISSASTFNTKTVMDEVANNGPLYFRFTVYADFMNYKSGIYQHKTGSSQGGHAVTLVGWGEEKGVKYWILQNSWGSSWGESGYFRMLRGTNHCDSENGFYGGPPVC
jgi:cathepsin B